MAQSKVWIVSDADTIDYRVPNRTGARSILYHLGSKDTGLQNERLLMYHGSKGNKSEDCHTEMNAQGFQDGAKIGRSSN